MVQLQAADKIAFEDDDDAIFPIGTGRRRMYAGRRRGAEVEITAVGHDVVEQVGAQLERRGSQLGTDAATQVADYAGEGGFVGLIDELLTRPTYGERWGQHWLDIVRYDAPKLLTELGPGWELLQETRETHMTPAGAEQRFGFYRIRRS